MEPRILPLLFGGDVNVYSMARAFHEAYGIRPVAYGKYPSGPSYQSQIVDYRVCEENEKPEVFYANVCDYAKANPTATVLVIGCGDSYVKLASQFKGEFPCNVIAPYIDLEWMERLTNKESFYQLCSQMDIPYPATFVYRKELGDQFKLDFDGPYICKPADSVAYWEHPFEGNEKVFFLANHKELVATLNKVYGAGYPDAMIIQEFIPGGDSDMRVLTSYSDQHGKVKMMCLGHVLLEEHSPHGIGNHAVIMTEDNRELCLKIKTFLEEIQFTGFSNFDIKIDPRDGTYKVFEINARQGRSNYYVTHAGCNLAEILVEDRVEQKELELKIVDKETLWHVVPRGVMFNFIPREYHEKMKQVARVNPVFYGKDLHPIRLLRLMKNRLRYKKQYNQYCQKEN